MVAKVFLIALLVGVVVCFDSDVFAKLREKASVRDVQADTSCYKLGCATTGQSCLSDFAASPPTINSCTSTETSCVQTTLTAATCVANIADGGACSTLSGQPDCKTTSVCTAASGSSNGTCVFSLLYSGSACTSNGQCRSNSCTGGFCNGVAVGVACTSTGDCTSPNYCSSSSVCTAPKASGASCSDDDECGYPNSCIPTSSSRSGAAACGRWGSVATGGFCTASIDCATDGNGCVPDNTNPTNTPTCRASTNSGVSCRNSTVCGMYETCSCNYNTGVLPGTCQFAATPLPSGSSSMFSNLVTCFNSKCSGSSATPQCVLGQCVNQYCSFLAKLNSAAAPSNYPTCYYNYANENPYPAQCISNSIGSSTSDSSMVGPSAAIFSMIAAAALLA